MTTFGLMLGIVVGLWEAKRSDGRGATVEPAPEDSEARASQGRNHLRILLATIAFGAFFFGYSLVLGQLYNAHWLWPVITPVGLALGFAYGFLGLPLS